MEATRLTEDEEKELVAGIEEALKSTQWRRALAPKNQKPYYYNKVSKVTQWTLPEEVIPVEKDLREKILSKRVVVEAAVPNLVESVAPITQSQTQNKLISESTANDSGNQSLLELFKDVQGNAEEETRLKDLLNQKDSLLDFESINNAKKLIGVYKTKPQAITESFAKSYVGYPQMCRILLELLLAAKGLESSKSSADVATSSSDSNEAEDIVLEHLASMVNQHFNKKSVDSAFLRAPQPPSWIKTLIANDKMRATLNDLTERHRDSSFLRHCSREMSAMGYGNRHTPVVISSELDGVARLYRLTSEIIVKVITRDAVTMLIAL